MKAYIILAMILLVPSASATEIIFDNWADSAVKYQTSDGRNFTISSNDDGSKIAFNLEKGGAIVEKGECESSNGVTLCYEDFAFSHYNYSLANPIVNEYKIRIEADVADVNFTRSFSTLQPELGELISVSATIRNNGEAASHFYFQDNYSPDFDVLLTTQKCERTSNLVSWRGSLESGQSASCTYVIKPKNASSYTALAFVEFDNGRKRRTLTDTIIISDYALGSKINISKNLSIDLEYNVTLQLLTTSNVSAVVYSLSFPPGIRITGYNYTDDWTEDSNTMRYSGNLGPDKKKIQIITLRAEGVGDQDIEERFSFRKINSTLSYNKGTSVFIDHTAPYLRLAASAPGDMHFFAVNPSKTQIRNVTVLLKSNSILSANEVIIKEIPQGGHRDFLVESNGDQPVSWTMNYQTKYGFMASVEGTASGNMAENISESSEAAAEVNQSIANEAVASLPEAPAPATEEAKPNADQADDIQTSIEQEIVQKKETAPVWLILAPIALMLVLLVGFVVLRRKHSQIE